MKFLYKIKGFLHTNNSHAFPKGILNGKCDSFLDNKKMTFTFTHYLAESFNWYSLDRPKDC